MITTYAGENDVVRQETVAHVVGKFVAEYSDIGLERLDGEEASYDRMHEAVQSLPFLAAKKLVILRKPSANKTFIEQFETFISDIPDTNEVILIEPKPDKRSTYYKQLKKLTNFKEFNLLDSNGLTRYLTHYAKEQGGNLGSTEARLLIDRVGLNQLILQHEVDKLLAYNPVISKQSIELLTERTAQSSIFELLDAAFAGKTKRAIELYKEQRAAQVEPQQILAMLIWQLHILALVKTSRNKTADTIAAESKISPYTIRKTQTLAQRISFVHLKKLIHDLRAFDVRLKSESISADEVVQYYILTINTQYSEVV